MRLPKPQNADNLKMHDLIHKEKVWLSPPHMSGNEQFYIEQAIETNWVSSMGENINIFEDLLQEYITNVHVAVLSSGTAALHLALNILGVQSGDEVLCQSFTFAASANPIKYLGATPIFIDSERDTWNICPVLLEKAILERIANGKKPKAIVAVHLYGMPYKIEEITEISKKYAIPVVEDSAEALGSTWKGEKCGGFGAIGVLSFNGNKIITTSGGGALVCKNVEFKKRAIFLASQAREDFPHYQHSSIGYNYRMSNILAGIGRGQMEVLENRILARRTIFNRYFQELSENSKIEFLKEPEGYYSNRWLSCIVLPTLEIREAIRLELLKNNIESRPLWKPMHMQPIFQECLTYTNGTSEDLFNRGLCLPSGSNLSQSDLKRIISIIKNIVS
jgi:dTDP-4-amino-4,6-dideoxygalactose transaminase